MINLKILHIAPFNIAGVPSTFVEAEKKLGIESRLITFSRNTRNYPEDICLELPLMNPAILESMHRNVSKKHVTNKTSIPAEIPLKWYPANLLERSLFNLREAVWKSKIDAAISKYEIDSFDIIQLDGGLGFYRDGREINRLKKLGKYIICCYTGSDLRVRGVIPQIDDIADLNVTVEFDHLQLHPSINHVFFPFSWENIKPVEKPIGKIIKIGHAPTNRLAKGSQYIIPVVNDLQINYPVRLVLIESLPYETALQRKAECDIFIDQLGDLGYGINSLEALCMKIPVCSCLAPGFAEKYPDHPFVEVNERNLKNELISLINSPELRNKLGKSGRKWVQQHHDAVSIVNQLQQLAGIH